MKTVARAVAVLLASLALLAPALPASATEWDYQVTGDPSGDFSHGSYDITRYRVAHVYENGRQFARITVTFRQATSGSVAFKLRWSDAGGSTYALYAGRKMAVRIQRDSSPRYVAFCQCSLSASGTRTLTVTVPWYQMNLDKAGGPQHIAGLRGFSMIESVSAAGSWYFSAPKDTTPFFGTLY